MRRINYMRIVFLSVAFVFASAIGAPAIDIGIDKAISVNLDFFDNKALVSELKIDNLNLKGAAISGDAVLKGKVLKDKDNNTIGFTGKLYSSNMTLNSRALPELGLYFKLTKDTLKIYALNFGRSYSLKGFVSLKKPFDAKLYFEIQRANIRDLALILKAKRPDVVTGIMNGFFSIQGPLDNPVSKGFITGRSGKIGPIWYDTAEIRTEGIGPIITIKESKIKQGQAAFFMEGFIDLRDVTGSNILSGINVKSDMKTIVWDGWDITRDGSDSLKMAKDLGDKISVGFKTVAREELPPFQKRENPDEMSLEYKMNSGQSFQMKLKENEEFLGVEHKTRF